MSSAYVELKLAWELFQKAPESLSSPERQRLTEVSGKQARIEQAILASSEAAGVVIPEATLSQRIDEIRQRYQDSDELFRDLARIGTDEADLARAVERDLRVEAVLEKIASDLPAVTVVDAEIYYRLHPAAFDRPETRRLRHILITFNSAKEKIAARATLEKLRSTLENAEKFAAAALRHSQCPTAMEGGVLGAVRRKQLFAELEPAAFALTEGEISEVLESPIGLHILRCDEILPYGLLPFSEVQERVIEHLNEQKRKKIQRDWIKSILS